MGEYNGKNHCQNDRKVREEIEEIYKSTFEQLSLMSSYSKCIPSFVTQFQKIGVSCANMWRKMFSCKKSDDSQAAKTGKKRGIKIEHLKLWCEDKYLGPDLTSGFLCELNDENISYETDHMMNKCKGGRMPVGRDTSCVRELLNRHHFLNNLIDESDIDNDGMLSEDEFYAFMLKVHEACRCNHSCVSLIDAIPKVKI